MSDERLDRIESSLQKLTVLGEDTNSRVRLLTDGVDAVNGRVDRLEKKVEAGFSVLKATLDLFVTGQGDINRAVEQRLRVLERDPGNRR